MFRPNASNGLWNPIILTLALGVSIRSPIDVATTLLSAYFSVISLIIAFRMYTKCHPRGYQLSTILYDLLIDSHPRGNSIPYQDLAHCFKIPIFMPLFYLGAFYVFGQMEVKSSHEHILLTVLFLIVYPSLLAKLFVSYPKSFTFGEGAIVIQAIVIYTYKQFVDFIWNIDDETSRTGSIVIIARMTLFIIMVWLYIASKSPKKFYLIGMVLVLGAYLPYLWLRLRRNLITWIIHDISQISTVFLLLFWSMCVISAIGYVQLYAKSESNTIDRKTFHLLASFVYVSGILFNRLLLYFASTVVLGLFLLIEFVRLHRIKPIGPLLDHYFRLFLDTKDCGPLVLTNIYLLIGLSTPLWLMDSENVLINASGVLAIGIGDSAASAIGSKFGTMPWSWESNKTVEGSLASVLAQMFGILILSRNTTYLMPGLWISTINSLVEAFTDQVDNLVVPLVAHVISVLIIGQI